MRVEFFSKIMAQEFALEVGWWMPCFVCISAGRPVQDVGDLLSEGQVKQLQQVFFHGFRPFWEIQLAVSRWVRTCFQNGQALVHFLLGDDQGAAGEPVPRR